ncbi:MAG: hypothetical protein ABI297_04950 [Ginsengibacter sp.]
MLKIKIEQKIHHTLRITGMTVKTIKSLIALFDHPNNLHII